MEVAAMMVPTTKGCVREIRLIQTPFIIEWVFLCLINLSFLIKREKLEQIDKTDCLGEFKNKNKRTSHSSISIVFFYMDYSIFFFLFVFWLTAFENVKACRSYLTFLFCVCESTFKFFLESNTQSVRFLI